MRGKGWLAAVPLVALTAGCIPPPGGPGREASGPTKQERLQGRIAELESAVADLRGRQEERQKAIGNIRERLEDLTVASEALRTDVRDHQGGLEVARHKLAKLDTRLRRIYDDVDTRLRALESTDKGADSGQDGAGGSEGEARDGQTTAEGEGPLAGKEEPQAAYETAFAHIEDQEYDAAAEAFRAFLDRFPNADLAPNARYWLGEAHYVRRAFEQALEAFRSVLAKSPDSQKAAAALLKIGYSFFELDNMAAARKALERVRERFPDSSEARLAKRRLAKIPDDAS